MRKRKLYVLLLCAVLALSAVALSFRPRPRAGDLANCARVNRLPHLRPDYSGTVIPPNIAPLNFVVEEPGAEYDVAISSKRGEGIDISSSAPQIAIPPGPWKRLLAANRGEELRFDLCVRPAGGRWQRFDSVINRIAQEEVDGYLVYRFINPVHNYHSMMSIRQRNLQNFDESVLLDSRDVEDQCMNCHTFLNNRGDNMIVQVRGPTGGMILERGGTLTKVDTRTKLNSAPAAFVSWHPSGRLIAFSVNTLKVFFHSARTELRDVVDMGSQLAVYSVESNTISSTPKITVPGRLETWPTWSPDGRYLYFCSAAKLWTNSDHIPPDQYEKVKYDLMRIGYDLGTGAWGEVETVLSSGKTGLSITQPRISPDGKFLVFCMSEYSTFPCYQPSSDLYLMDLRTGRYARMECNSDQADTYHSWSSNSRWLVFTSKRGTGLFGRVYFSYIEENGKAEKPFILPQRNPAFYDSLPKLYQLPELIVNPVRVNEHEFARAVLAPGPIVSQLAAVTSATPKAEPAPAVPVYGPQERTETEGE